MLGGDTCPREGFVPAQVDDILGLPEQGHSAVVMCTAGYRAKDDKHADMAKIRDKTEAMVQYIDSCIDLIEVDLTEDTGS